MTTKLDPRTRLRRLLMQARDELHRTIDAVGWDKAREEPALLVRIALIRSIDRALTDVGEPK